MSETTVALERPMAFRVRLDGIAACTDGANIFLDDRLNEIQLKCAVVHELIHVELGHSTAQSEAVELSVRYEAARRLLPVMTGECALYKTVTTAARGLGVTRQVLLDRTSTMTDREAAAAGCADCRLCPAMAARFNLAERPAVDNWREQVQWAS